MSAEAVTVEVARNEDVVLCGAQAQRMAQRAGFARRGQHEVAIIVQELASNIVRYTPGGAITLRVLPLPRRGVEVCAEDSGPGLGDVEAKLRDGHSEPPTGPEGSSTDPPRRSLGVGLGAVQRLSDDLVIDSQAGRGTRIVARKYVPTRKS